MKVQRRNSKISVIAVLIAERLAAVGRLVSEIAHDMKSPLMAIGGFVNQGSRKLQAGEPDRKKLDLVVRETSRLESMVKEMVDFGRSIQLQKSTESLNGLVNECIEVNRPIAEGRDVEIKTDLILNCWYCGCTRTESNKSS
jgi:two-component system sensor histidine kinase HydH